MSAVDGRGLDSICPPTPDVTAVGLYHPYCRECRWFYNEGFTTAEEAIDYALTWHTVDDCPGPGSPDSRSDS